MLRDLGARAASLLVLAAASALAIVLRAPSAPVSGPRAEPTLALVATRAEPEPEPEPVASPRARTQIGVPDQSPLELYPPSTTAGALPLTLALHGRDMDPIDLCERWANVGQERGWLACPAGNKPEKEAFDWGGSADERLTALDAQLSAIDALYGQRLDRRLGDVIVGFSRGAFLARDLVEARPGRFRGMIVLGAAVRLDPDRLKASGVRRVLLACGDKDEARPTMTRTASRLAAGGVEARFMSLGPLYHVLPDDLAPVMRTALAWVNEQG
jgi:predicted esterase